MNDLTDVFLEVARRVDGKVLVERALGRDAVSVGDGPIAVLAVGKVAFPMFDGLVAAIGSARIVRGLLVAPETRFREGTALPPGVRALVSDHPQPSERSVAAGRAALELVESLGDGERLVVLLSGGGSAAMAVPVDGLTLEDKRETTRAVARAGATIAELNTVRKHLSAIKGGQLAALARVPTIVLALSDVVGNDPGVIASGPFSADPTTYAEALALVERLAPGASARALGHLRRGATGALPETPKPGDPRLARVDYRLLATPETVVEEASRAIGATHRPTGFLSSNTESSVEELAARYGKLAREASGSDRRRVFIGNGEPSIVVRGEGRGGRATHLALLMAREIAGVPGASFLAAGTDDRDGSSHASGAIVTSDTWARAEQQGLDPAGALERCDSETPLEALGCLVRGPGTSNLLDLHLLSVD